MTTAAVNTGRYSLLDHIKSRDPDGKIAPFVEPLAMNTPFLEDALFIEGNLPTGHRFTSRTALPTASYRQFNKGDTATKGKLLQIDEAAARLGTRSEIDCALAELGGNVGQVRMNEEKGHVLALGNTAEEGFFYNNVSTDPERFQGLNARLYTAKPGEIGASQIIPVALTDANAGKYTSMYLVQWSEQGVHCIYPKGSQAGFKRNDMGVQNIPDGTAAGNTFRGYQVDWEWYLGLCVKDRGAVARVANIDTVALSMTDDTLMPAMTKAWYRIRNPGAGRLVWYANRTAVQFLDLQARAGVKAGGGLTFDNVDGKPVLMHRGIPIRVSDGIKDTETFIPVS
jgi:hypothetical protein